MQGTFEPAKLSDKIKQISQLELIKVPQLVINAVIAPDKCDSAGVCLSRNSDGTNREQAREQAVA